MLTSPLAETLMDGPPTNRTTGKVSSRTRASVMAGMISMFRLALTNSGENTLKPSVQSSIGEDLKGTRM